LLEEVADVHPPAEPAWGRSNWQSYCVRLPPGVAQRSVMQEMLNAGVATRRGVTCAHLEPTCASIPRRHPLTVSEQVQAQCILLPLFPQMTDQEQDHVVRALRDAIASQKRTRRVKVPRIRSEDVAAAGIHCRVRSSHQDP
jgi:perosamine synthetase